MTLKQAKKLYIASGRKCFEPSWSAGDYSTSEWKSIQDEMNRIVDAPSERKAVDVVRWWGCWDFKCSAIGYARTVRNIWKQMKPHIEISGPNIPELGKKWKRTIDM